MLFRTLRSNQALLAICGATAITMSGQGIISPILPLYAKTFGVNVALIGLAVSAFSLARLFINLPAGLAAAVFGPRRVIAAGAAVFATANLLAGLADNIWLLILCRVLTGAGSAAFQTASYVVVSDLSTPENRGRFMSYYELSFLSGISIGPILGGFMAEQFGYASPFFLVSLLAGLGALWAVMRIPEMPRHPPRSTAPATERLRLRVLLRPELAALALPAMASFFTRSGSQLGLGPLVAAQRAGLAPAQIGTVFTGMIVTQMSLIPFTGRLVDRFGPRRLLVPGLLTLALAVLALAAAPNIWGYVLFSLLIGVATALGGPALPSYAAAVAPAGSGAGLSMGLYRTYGDIGHILGGPVLGWIADQTDFEGALVTNAVVLGIAALGFWVLSRDTRAAAGRRR